MNQEEKNNKIIVDSKLNGNEELKIKMMFKDKEDVDVEINEAWKIKMNMHRVKLFRSIP